MTYISKFHCSKSAYVFSSKHADILISAINHTQ